MILPQRLDFGAEIIVFGDDLRVRVIADDAPRRFIRRAGHGRPRCRDDAQ